MARLRGPIRGERKVVIDGYPFWPLVFTPWLIGVVVIVKAVITALV